MTRAEFEERRYVGERVYVWPDFTWCFETELWQFDHKSDDYVLLTVPRGVEDVAAWVASLEVSHG